MSDSINKDKDKIYQLINEGKEAEALQLVNKLKQENSYPLKDKLNLLFLNSYTVYLLGSFEESPEVH